MNYTSKCLIEQICLRESRRQKAVFLAGRIKKASASPGFSWDKATVGFALQFKKETWDIKEQIRKEYPEHPEDPIEWKHIIVHFSNQQYKKKESL